MLLFAFVPGFLCMRVDKAWSGKLKDKYYSYYMPNPTLQ